jgi:tetratricopeptide (TPR) repeat protein
MSTDLDLAERFLAEGKRDSALAQLRDAQGVAGNQAGLARICSILQTSLDVAGLVEAAELFSFHSIEIAKRLVEINAIDEAMLIVTKEKNVPPREFLSIANLLGDAGNLSAKGALLEAAQRLHPGSLDICKALVKTLIDSDRKHEARREIDQLALCLPRDVETQLKLVPLYKTIRALDQVERLSSAVLGSDPGNMLATRELIEHVLTSVGADKGGRKVVELCDAALLRQDLVIADLLFVAMTYMTIAQPHAAKVPILKAVAISTNLVQVTQVRLVRVEVLWRCGEEPKALEELNDVTAGSLTAHQIVKAAQLYEGLSSPERAIQTADRALNALDAKDVSMRLKVADLFCRLSNKTGALAIAISVDLLSIENISWLRSLQNIYFELGRYEDSLRIVERMLVDLPYDRSLVERHALNRIMIRRPSDLGDTPRHHGLITFCLRFFRRFQRPNANSSR